MLRNRTFEDDCLTLGDSGEIVEDPVCTYERNKDHFHELWDTTTKSIIYVIIIFTIYIIFVIVTILHETYKVIKAF